MAVETVCVGGATLAYEVWGRGAPLVCLHGGLGVDSSYLKTPAITGLAGDERRVVVFDQLGHGRSERVPIEEYSHERWAADVRDLATALGADRVSLLGHSYGGFLALEVATRYPTLIDCLVLVATSAGPVAAAAPDVASDEELRGLYAAQWPVYFADDDKHWDVFARLGFSALPFLAAFRRELPRYDLRDVVSDIAVPALLVVGDADPYEGPMRWLAAALPDARLEIFEGVGHFPFLERPERFRSVVDEFLSEG